MSIIWKRWRQSDSTPTSTQLAAEAEAFLSGRARDVLREQMQAVPAWAAVNVLAHGDLDTLRRLVAGVASGEPYPDIWVEPLAVLATQILVLADEEPVSFRELQSQVLIPLEARLLAVHETRISPSQLVVSCRATLCHHRRQC